MSVSKRLSEVFKESPKITYNDSSRIIIMSDCHRGDGSGADTFSHNQNLFFTALSYYYNNNYTYVELGDGDELWENKNPKDIIKEHSDAFWIMSKFFEKDRLYMIFGNHDICKKSSKTMKKHFHSHYEESQKMNMPLFEGMQVYEGLILNHETRDNKIFLVHGHQGDFINDKIWRITRFLVRYVWRHLEILGIKDPTSTAKNYEKKDALEKKIIKWVEKENQMLIAGHTHRPTFPRPKEIPYFNDGSCVHPRCITGIEICDGNISLVKWSFKTKEDGVVYAGKDVLEGPIKLNEYFI